MHQAALPFRKLIISSGGYSQNHEGSQCFPPHPTHQLLELLSAWGTFSHHASSKPLCCFPQDIPSLCDFGFWKQAKKQTKKQANKPKNPGSFADGFCFPTQDKRHKDGQTPSLGRGRGEGKTKRGNKQIREYSAVYKRDRPKKMSRLAIFQRCLGSQISS